MITICINVSLFLMHILDVDAVDKQQGAVALTILFSNYSLEPRKPSRALEHS